MDTTILEKIGLTRNEALVYLALLKRGSTSAKGILRESGLHRSRVYECLERLQGRGLVSSVIKGFRRYFQAVPPEQLLDFVEEQKEALKQILPELKQLEGTNKEELDGALYKGKEGVKTILSMVLKEKQDVYILGAKGLIFSELKYYMPNFEKERIKRNIKFIRIYDSKEHAQRATPAPLVEGKSLPTGFKSDSVVWIFGGKVAILLWKNKYPSAFVIERKEVADAFRKWFSFIYKSLK